MHKAPIKGSMSQGTGAPPGTVKTETTVRKTMKNGKTYTTTTTKYTMKNGSTMTKTMTMITS